uniref:Uncharacterized protein n=1 Tax=Mola mola TaxID=94237 RepID=A0A3Q3VN37_MOLML
NSSSTHMPIMFVGHCISADTVTPDPVKVKAIMEITEPTGVEDVRRVMEMANYLGKFLPHLASYTRPIKYKEAFRRLKSELSSTRVLTSYSPAVTTCVAAESLKNITPKIEKERTDHVCDKLINCCKTEWPEKYALPPELVAYDPEKENLTVSGELLRRHRTVTPYCMRQEILSKLHRSSGQCKV